MREEFNSDDTPQSMTAAEYAQEAHKVACTDDDAIFGRNCHVLHIMRKLHIPNPYWDDDVDPGMGDIQGATVLLPYQGVKSKRKSHKSIT